MGLHFCSSYWGPDVDVYDPSRWDPNNTKSFLQKYNDTSTYNTTEASTAKEVKGSKEPVLLKPLRGAWIPFSDGIRACLGKKFAQVEFVAVLTVLLRRHRVELLKMAQQNGPLETDEQAKRRVEKIVFGALNRTGLTISETFGVVFKQRK